MDIEKIRSLIDEFEIKFIRLAFSDIYGRQKNIAIMSDQLEHALKYGVSFDASQIKGFMDVTKSDLFLFPDLDTFSIVPWRPSEGGVARFYCYIKYPDGRPFEGDGRYLLMQREEEARKKGFSFLVGPECEFYLFQLDGDGYPTETPYDRASYFDISPLDKGEDIRRDICFALEDMHVTPERSHHEQGPGQNEVDFRCSSPLKAADDLMTFKTTVKAISQSYGLFASFLPKPLLSESGSGLHVNLSIFENGKNLFADFQKAPNPKATSFMQGILNRIGEITLFANQLPGSYARFGKCEAPSHVSWSSENRSTLVRVPAAKDEDSRMEVRSPDPAANPYLLFTLLLAAGFEGIEQGSVLGEEKKTPSHAKDLPTSLSKAVKLARNSQFVSSVIPESTLSNFLEEKQKEAMEYEKAENQHQYDMERYFPYI